MPPPAAERVLMLQPWEKGLLGTTLPYAYEVRNTSAYFDDLPDVTVPKDMLSLAEHILDTKATDFDPSLFHDRYEEAVVAMLKTKQAGLPATKDKPEKAGAGNVIDLMEALKRSLAGTPAPKQAIKVKKPRKTLEGQREMLLPISGSKPAAKKAPAKPAEKASGRRKAAGTAR